MENAAAPPKKKGSTPYRGVRIIRASGRYGAEITVPGEGRRVWLGTFRSAEAAALAYDRAARTYDSSESRTNFPAPSRRESPPVTEESSKTVMPFNLNLPPPLD